MRVKFSQPFDYVPSGEPRVTIAYRPDGPAGGEYTVKREAGEAAVQAGAAKEVPAPSLTPDKANKGDAERG